MNVSILANTTIQPILFFILIIVLKFGIYGAWIGIFTSQFVAMTAIILRYKSEKWIRVKL